MKKTTTTEFFYALENKKTGYWDIYSSLTNKSILINMTKEQALSSANFANTPIKKRREIIINE